MTEEKKGPSPELLAQLERKLEEYTQSVASGGAAHALLLFSVARIYFREEGNEEKFYRAKFQLEQIRRGFQSALEVVEEELKQYNSPKQEKPKESK